LILLRRNRFRRFSPLQYLYCKLLSQTTVFGRRNPVSGKGDDMADAPTHHALGDRAAFQLANVTKTPPQYSAITPRWLVRLLDWKPLEAGTFRVNRFVDEEAVELSCGTKDEKSLPDTFVDYEEKPREYTLCAISRC
jgi:hypothetical protein